MLDSQTWEKSWSAWGEAWGCCQYATKHHTIQAEIASRSGRPIHSDSQSELTSVSLHLHCLWRNNIYFFLIGRSYYWLLYFKRFKSQLTFPAKLRLVKEWKRRKKYVLHVLVSSSLQIIFKKAQKIKLIMIHQIIIIITCRSWRRAVCHLVNLTSWTVQRICCVWCDCFKTANKRPGGFYRDLSK